MTPTPPGDALHRLLHAYKRAMREAWRAQGIDLPHAQVRVLKAVCHLPECTAHAIALRMHRDKAQITRVVQDLCTRGLVEQRPDPADGRRRILMPTAAGRTLRKRIATAERKAGARMMRGLPESSVDEFTRLAEAMAANLDPEE